MKEGAELLVYVNLAEQNFQATAPLTGDTKYEDYMTGAEASANIDVPAHSFKLITSAP